MLIKILNASNNRDETGSQFTRGNPTLKMTFIS